MEHEGLIRGIFFFVVFALVAYGEMVAQYAPGSPFSFDSGDQQQLRL